MFDKIAKMLMSSPIRTSLQELKDGTFVVQALKKDEERTKKLCKKISDKLNCVIAVRTS